MPDVLTAVLETTRQPVWLEPDLGLDRHLPAEYSTVVISGAHNDPPEIVRRQRGHLDGERLIARLDLLDGRTGRGTGQWQQSQVLLR